MEKAYDVSALAANLKGRGLDIAEEAAKIVVEETVKWIDESAKLSENKLDDLALVVLPSIKDLVLSAVDKIDGQVG